MASTILSDNGVTSGVAGLKTSADSTGVLALQTTTSGGAATTAVTIDTSQNVGIGLTSPGAKLDVYNSAAAAANNEILRLRYTTSVTAGTSGDLNFASNGGIIIGRISSVVQDGSNVALAFSTWNNTLGERMRIDSTGSLLVNTTSATGASKFVVAADTTSVNPMTVSNTRSTAATDYSILFYRNASLVGSVQTTLSATSYVTSSDYRLKENIQPMAGALAKVAQLKPVTYKWKLDGTEAQGFIAHELQAVVPDCVTGQKDEIDADGNPKYQGIDTSFLVATLTAAIQEQQALITAQTETINALVTRIEALENK
jgi:hypothetical protein